jgi:bifunctional non-homologous end joining protein LigD
MAAKKSANKAPAKAAKPKAAKPKDAADEVDEQLARYRSMRDFGITAEPSGGSSPAPL